MTSDKRGKSMRSSRVVRTGVTEQNLSVPARSPDFQRPAQGISRTTSIRTISLGARTAHAG